MRSLIILGLLLFTAPAFADSISGFCLAAKDPQACMSYFLEGEARHNRMLQQEAANTQLEAARIQAQGMALMGSGPAFINGMNQAFRPLPMPVMPTVQPYIVPVPRSPINCISQTYGANMPAITCY